jgi:uncharacterized membrane protein
MNFFGLFGNIFEIFIVITIVRVIYKSVIKGRSGTLDSSITKFVNDVKREMNGGKAAENTTTPSARTKPSLTYEQRSSDDDLFAKAAAPKEKHENADELYRAGLITKEEYRKIK